jgi:DNA processing protein
VLSLEKGGTWAGAVEQLEKLRLVPVYVRGSGEIGPGLEALRRKGALPWPDPTSVADFLNLFEAAPVAHTTEQLSLL